LGDDHAVTAEPPPAGDAAGGQDRHNDYEYQALVRLPKVLPSNFGVRVVTNCGLGDRKLYRALRMLKLDFVTCFKDDIIVTAAGGEARAAAEWVGVGGLAHMVRDAAVRRACSTGSSRPCHSSPTGYREFGDGLKDQAARFEFERHLAWR
jgi:hypothetical protein